MDSPSSAQDRVSATPSSVTRRDFLVHAAAGMAALAARSPCHARAAGGGLPITGAAIPELEPFDTLMASFIEENQVPGAALAVAQAGKLVYARGFGLADVEKQQPVQPTSLFRIASVSKPITGVAVMQLVERGVLKLDEEVIGRMKLRLPALPKDGMDPRWARITVRQCLQHTGGWDRDVSFDPIGRPWEIAEALGIRPPVTPAHVVRYMMGRPLDFDPGERCAYSNLGYLVLGRVIEAVTGRSYESHVRKDVLRPLGIGSMRLGRALAGGRTKGEVKYYVDGNPTGAALYPPQLGETVPVQYGARNFEAYEAHGGWIASAVDLVKFASAFDDPSKCPLLAQGTVEEMWARPDGSAGQESDGSPRAYFHGCGWLVRPASRPGTLNAWHTGWIEGSEALLVRRYDGLSWAVLFNTSASRNGQTLATLIDGRVHEAADKVRSWPQGDLFETYAK